MWGARLTGLGGGGAASAAAVRLVLKLLLRCREGLASRHMAADERTLRIDPSPARPLNHPSLCAATCSTSPSPLPSLSLAMSPLTLCVRWHRWTGAGAAAQEACSMSHSCGHTLAPCIPPATLLWRCRPCPHPAMKCLTTAVALLAGPVVTHAVAPARGPVLRQAQGAGARCCPPLLRGA